AQIVGRLGLEAAIEGRQVKLRAMQHQAWRGFTAVESITSDRSADRSQLRANLMLAARLERELHQGALAQTSSHAEMRDRALTAALDHSALGAFHGHE